MRCSTTSNAPSPAPENRKGRNCSTWSSWAAALLLPVSCLLTVHLVQTTAAAAPEPLKWVDFTPTYEAMQAALQMDIATVESETHLDWIESLAWLGCRYGGNFSRYRYSDLAALRKKRESGQSMAELAEGNPYYDYYYRAYSAVPWAPAPGTP